MGKHIIIVRVACLQLNTAKATNSMASLMDDNIYNAVAMDGGSNITYTLLI